MLASKYFRVIDLPLIFHQLMEPAFKVAANSLAHLYKESVLQSRKSYQSGYEQGLQDIWEFVSLRNPTSDGQISVLELTEYLKLKHTQSQNEIPKKEEIQIGSSSSTASNAGNIVPAINSRDTDLKRRWNIDDMGLDDCFTEGARRTRTRTEKMSD